MMPGSPAAVAASGLGQGILARAGLDPNKPNAGQPGGPGASGVSGRGPVPPGAADPTQAMPTRPAGAAGAAGSGDPTQAVPAQPRGYSEHTMQRAQEPTEAIHATSGGTGEPDEGPAPSYPPAFEDRFEEHEEYEEYDDDERIRPARPGGDAPGGASERPSPSERRYGP